MEVARERASVTSRNVGALLDAGGLDRCDEVRDQVRPALVGAVQVVELGLGLLVQSRNVVDAATGQAARHRRDQRQARPAPYKRVQSRPSKPREHLSRSAAGEKREGALTVPVARASARL
jgi:hypothetical protein